MISAVRIIRSRTPVSDPAPGAIAIKGSVGQGGSNGTEDTRAVQTALNAVPACLSGPDTPLDVDGRVGPLTIGAIRDFQQRWLSVVDGRVDPKGPTLRLLNRMPGLGDAVPADVGLKMAHSEKVGAVGGKSGKLTLT
jgi:peptidoglycan hydrolase-like protein with peptidoglycan-binding domain